MTNQICISLSQQLFYIANSNSTDYQYMHLYS